jgi:2-methylcitrate dehydratase
MLRNHDFNDNATSIPGGGGGHFSDMLPGIFAVGEALHVAGTQTLLAIVAAYECLAALQIADADHSNQFDRLYVGTAAAIGIGKVMKLNQDQLANALSLALVPYLPIGVSHASGPMSMWKGSHTAAAVRSAVFASILAREGMTGPCAPFEGVKGLWDAVSGPYKEFRIPASPDGELAVQKMVFKRYPAEGSAQTILEILPSVREAVKVPDIETVQVEMRSFGEIGDPSKWDPRNTETADHSMPFIVATALSYGDVYLNSFEESRYLHDPALRQLMDKISLRETPDSRGTRITVKTRSGAEITKEAQEKRTPMTRQEIDKKFDRICAFKSISDKDRDRIRNTWSDLRSVKDIAEAMHGLAHYGKTKA